MSDDLEKMPVNECAICYAAHDAEIHEATLSIHRWFHSQVTHDFEDDRVYLHALDKPLGGDLRLGQGAH